MRVCTLSHLSEAEAEAPRGWGVEGGHGQIKGSPPMSDGFLLFLHNLDFKKITEMNHEWY